MLSWYHLQLMPEHELDLFPGRTPAPFCYKGSDLFSFQICYIDRDRSENFIHHASCLILRSQNIVSKIAREWPTSQPPLSEGTADFA